MCLIYVGTHKANNTVEIFCIWVFEYLSFKMFLHNTFYTLNTPLVIKWTQVVVKKPGSSVFDYKCGQHFVFCSYLLHDSKEEKNFFQTGVFCLTCLASSSFEQIQFQVNPVWHWRTHCDHVVYEPYIWVYFLE